jgi:hypothetical protein
MTPPSSNPIADRQINDVLDRLHARAARQLPGIVAHYALEAVKGLVGAKRAKSADAEYYRDKLISIRTLAQLRRHQFDDGSGKFAEAIHQQKIDRAAAVFECIQSVRPREVQSVPQLPLRRNGCARGAPFGFDFRPDDKAGALVSHRCGKIECGNAIRRSEFNGPSGVKATALRVNQPALAPIDSSSARMWDTFQPPWSAIWTLYGAPRTALFRLSCRCGAEPSFP